MRTRLSILLVFVMVLTFVPLGPAGANGYWPISEPTTLTEDYYGQIKITANNITLDCDGYSVIGDGTGNGILLQDRTGVTIRNCHLSGFEHGIFLFAADNSVITNNQSNGNTGFGFLLMYSDSNTLYRNIAEGNGATGFDLGASNGNTLHHNYARGNLHSGFSFWLEASNNTMTFNLAEENVVDGFFVLPEGSTGNTFSHNRAFRNGHVGIDDQTTGETGDGGTDDYYDHNVCVGNEGGGSYPTGLCLPHH